MWERCCFITATKLVCVLCRQVPPYYITCLCHFYRHASILFTVIQRQPIPPRETLAERYSNIEVVARYPQIQKKNGQRGALIWNVGEKLPVRLRFANLNNRCTNHDGFMPCCACIIVIVSGV